MYCQDNTAELSFSNSSLQSSLIHLSVPSFSGTKNKSQCKPGKKNEHFLLIICILLDFLAPYKYLVSALLFCYGDVSYNLPKDSNYLEAYM